MVEQAGTGASAAAPMVRAVYNGLLGVGQPAALPSSTPVSQLPKISPVSRRRRGRPRRWSAAPPATTRVAGRPPLIAPPAAAVGAPTDDPARARPGGARCCAGPLRAARRRARSRCGASGRCRSSCWCSPGSARCWSGRPPAPELAADGGNPQTYLDRHLLNIAIGPVLLVVAARVDLRRLRLFGPVLYLASLLGLLAVLGDRVDRSTARAPGS